MQNSRLRNVRVSNEISEGEVRLEQFNQMLMAKKSQKNGRIGEVEQGEIMNFGNGSQPVKYVSNDRSEGEVDNLLLEKKKDLLNGSQNKSNKSNKSQPKVSDKTVVDLKISPSKSSKNNIRIQSLPSMRNFIIHL